MDHERLYRRSQVSLVIWFTNSLSVFKLNIEFPFCVVVMNRTNLIDPNNIDVSDRSRLDAEWVTANALREVLGIALKGTESPTYLQTLVLASKLIPELFDPDRSILIRQQESVGVREYRQIAEARSKTEGKTVTPLAAVNFDIEKYKEWIRTGGDRSILEGRLYKLYKIRDELQLRAVTEQQAIIRDIFQSNKNLPVSKQGIGYREFALSNKRRLRIRILHPDPPEQSTGADVIYENFDDDAKLVRLAALQYKIWDQRRIYRDDRAGKQLEKLSQVFCDNRFCRASRRDGKGHYRLPYCTAFLRPTDRLQQVDSKLESSGYHIPVCVVKRSWQPTDRGGQQLLSRDVRREAVTHRVFEELFNTGMLGSRWLTYKELERLYRTHKIMNDEENIIIHAQEF